MTLKAYGVLKARVTERLREGAGDDTPHYQLHLVDETETHYRASVNVKSQETPSELLYHCDDAFDHPVLTGLEELPDGWSPLPSAPGGMALDLIRGNLLDVTALRVLPADAQGPDNDLADLLDHYVLRAIADQQSRVLIFGEPWSEPAVPDKIFHFPQGAGVHDVHMNQGNSPQFAGDDGVWQDGALLLHLPSAGRWVAIFLGFQSQEWHTDDRTGHSLGVQGEATGPRPGGIGAHVRIVGAVVNPVDEKSEAESVTFLNTTPEPVSLEGWSIADRAKNRTPLSGTIPPGECSRQPVLPPAQLGNGGGLITLLDAAGLKMDGVAYTWRDAKADGWTVTF